MEASLPDDAGPAGATAAFAPAPVAWFYLGSIAELARGPRAYALPGGQRFVGFLGADRSPVVLAARCSHMGADLVGGRVCAGRIVCPLHGWEYGADGTCVHIPVAPGAPIPAHARQARFPVATFGGHVFFFNRLEPRFPAPFFAVEPQELRPAPAFDLRDDVPWYFIGANGFDVQHFRNAHDRVLLAEPVVAAPHAYARQVTVRLGVAGRSLTDRLTRAFAGPEVTMSITVWGGTLIFVEARFRRTITYGLMTVHPLEHNATHCRVIVWVRRSDSGFARFLVDPVNAALRRFFIQTFLRSDLGRMAGVRYAPDRLIEADKPLVSYMDWLRAVHR